MKHLDLKDEQKQNEKEHAVNSFKLNSSMARIVQKKIEKLGSELKNDVAEWSQTFLNRKTSAPNIFDTIIQTIYIMENEILQNRLQQMPPDILIEPNIDSVSSFEFHKAKEIIQQGEEAAQKAIPSIKKLLRSRWTRWK